MNDLSRETVATLLQAEGAEPKITIYAPMHTPASPPHMTENQIRFKNLMHQAADQLKAQGDKHMAQILYEQVERHMLDLAFWESQTEGLLICADPEQIQYFHLPIDTDEYVAIDNCYHLAPVLALLGDEQSFYVLAIAQHQPKLFSGSLYGLYEMEAGLPENLEDSLRLDEMGQQREQSQAKGSNVSFNGRGGRRDPREEERLRFFRLIDSAVMQATERGLPLILAGTDSEIAEYRAISKHPDIMDRTITGSFTGAKPHELYRQAYAIIYNGPVAARREQALQSYASLKGSSKERVTEDPLAIAEAAEQGRIDTLLIALKRTTADTVRDTARAVERITFPHRELSTLVNSAANAVANARGRIVNIDEEAAPGTASVMALLRY